MTVFVRKASTRPIALAMILRLTTCTTSALSVLEIHSLVSGCHLQHFDFDPPPEVSRSQLEAPVDDGVWSELINEFVSIASALFLGE